MHTNTPKPFNLVNSFLWQFGASWDIYMWFDFFCPLCYQNAAVRCRNVRITSIVLNS